MTHENYAFITMERFHEYSPQSRKYPQYHYTFSSLLRVLPQDSISIEIISQYAETEPTAKEDFIIEHHDIIMMRENPTEIGRPLYNGKHKSNDEDILLGSPATLFTFSPRSRTCCFPTYGSSISHSVCSPFSQTPTELTSSSLNGNGIAACCVCDHIGFRSIK